MPNSPFVAVSQRIENENKKEELKELVKKILPKNTGGIVRTTCENVSLEEIKADIEKLVSTWNKLIDVEFDNYPKEIYNNGGIVRKYIIDNLDKNIDRIVVANQRLKDKIEQFLEIENKDIKVDIDVRYLDRFDFQNQLRRLENRKIWLDCGGFITIDKTEALTAIDVNSGKFIGKDNYENTVFIVNKQAAVEIAKQLRARDIRTES